MPLNKNSETHIFFQPTFGNRPEQIVGRSGELTSFLRALNEPVGARERCTLILGQRGMGKTAMLLEIADRASDAGYIVARVTAHEGMPESIIEQIQLNGSKFFREDKKQITGVNAGALGLSFGLSFSEAAQQQYGFRSKLSMLCDKLEEKNKGVLILIDEVHTSKEMREVAASYQELVGDKKNIAICMAGLPYAVSEVLNDKVLTFLNRANKVNLGPISVAEIQAYFEHAFRVMKIKCSDELLAKAAEKSIGIPYLMQLIGYYLTIYSKDSREINEQILKKSEVAAICDLDDNVFKPIIAPLSDNDLEFVEAMAMCKEPVTNGELVEKLGWKKNAIQPYRRRLLDAGIIEAPHRGELVFAIPYFAEYIRKQNGIS